jgi:menaquinone-specific isochorismate synthase
MKVEELAAELKKLKIEDVSFAEWENANYQTYAQEFDHLLERFDRKELSKAVPYVFEKSPKGISRQELVHSLKAVLKNVMHHPVFAYGFWNNHSGMLGATPEELFRRDSKNLISTMACAGTKARGNNEDMLLHDPKELHEHELVVKDVSQALSCYGRVQKGQRQLKKLSRLVHLLTPIELHLDTDISFETIVSAMHPTAALGAVPRNAGKQWLVECAKRTPRGRYGAPVGVIYQGLSLCLVAIRNMQWNREETKLFAGGGVVPGTTVQREWQEIQLKLSSIKELLKR